MAAHLATVITISDRSAAGTAEDRSGPAVAAALEAAGFSVAQRHVVADDLESIRERLRASTTALVVTTGGTGIAARDVTPEATRAEAEYEVPGLGEEMRRAGRETTPMAIASRGTGAVLPASASRGRALVLNLPGSVAGATESLAAVAPVLAHLLDLLAGDTEHRPA